MIKRNCPLTYNHNYVHNRLITFIINFCFTEDHPGIADHVAGNSKAFLAVPGDSVAIRNKPFFWIPLGRERNYKYLIKCYPKVKTMVTKEIHLIFKNTNWFSLLSFDPS